MRGQMKDKNPKRSRKQNQKGAALVIALVVLFLLTALAAGLIFATQSEMWATANYQQLTQSRYAAEAGAQMAKNWFENSYTSPTSLSAYNTTVAPVKCATGSTTCTANSPIVLGGTAGNFPSASVKTSFSNALTSQSVPGVANASYSVTAQLMQMPSTMSQTWQITSVGSVAGVKAAQTQVVETIQSNMKPTFQDALFATGTGCSSVIINGGSSTDGYNSNLGAYGGANINTTGGSVGTNGNVYIAGGSHLDGNVYTPDYASAGPCSGGSVTGLTNSGGTITGTEQNITPPVYSNPSFESPYSPVSGTTSLTAAKTLGPGTYPSIYTSGGGSLLTLSGGGTYTLGDVTINGVGITLYAGTYYVNSFTVSGGAMVNIASGPVYLNINPANTTALSNPQNCQTGGPGSTPYCPFNIQGGSKIVNNTTPANFEIEYGGTGDVVLSGGSSSQAVVYAPSAPVSILGGSPWFGAIIGNTIDDDGGSSIHYDTALQNAFPLPGGGFTQTGFTWSKN